MPGPGTYEPANVVNFGRSSRREDDERPSAWARSKSARMPGETASDAGGGEGSFEYNPQDASKPTVASKASAMASPSMQSQRGHGIHSSNPEPRLARLPFHQQAINASSPGPGYYDSLTDGTIAKTLKDGSIPSKGRGLASTAFRSSTPQHATTGPIVSALAVPPPGAYDAPISHLGSASSSRSGDMSKLLFASKQERFPPTVTIGTDVNVGPGTYNPETSQVLQEERHGGGKEGARSYPFSSTDRRYRSGKTGPGEHDVYVAADGRVYQ